MKDQSLKDKKRKINPHYEAWLRTNIKDDCKVQFIIWAETKHLDTSGIEGPSGPVFRPAICAWEGWKAAWELRGNDGDAK